MQREQYVRLDIEKVVGSLAHACVPERVERGDCSTDRRAPREPRAFARGDVLVRGLVEHGVIEEREMRFRDFSSRRAADATDACQSGAHESERTVEIGALGCGTLAV